MSRGDGKILVQSRRLTDGALMKNTTFLSNQWLAQDLAVMADVDGNPATDDPAFAVLATNPATGRRLAQVRRVASGELVKNVDFLATSWRLLGVVNANDVNGDGRPEIGVLAERRSGDGVRIQLADIGTREIVGDLTVSAAAKTDQWRVLLYGASDSGYLEINGQRVAECTVGGYHCDLDVSTFLHSGANVVRLVIEQTSGGGTDYLDYEITRDGVMWVYGRCGWAGTPACPPSGVPGTVLDRSFIVAF
jgi:hypothetical protein